MGKKGDKGAMETPGINTLATPAELRQAITTAVGGLIVLDFTATWCGVCKKINPFLTTLARDYTASESVSFFAVDVDTAKELSNQYNPPAVPFFVFLKDGKKVDTLLGAKQTDLRRKVLKYAK
eukprot:m.167579 g.167579  ORF g.167579 m.167579 type:complete len:123 (+) comp31467_c0_seq5:1070-1438(+)